MRRRFGMLALVVAADQWTSDTLELSKAQQRQVETILPKILADPDEVTANQQELVGDAADLVLALPEGNQRDELSQSLLATMDKL